MGEQGDLTITCKQDMGKLLLSFKDTGTGIAQEDLPHIFDPFFTTKDVGEGTGLGLAVSYSLVNRMQGKIDVQSELGKGTEFTIELPIQDENSQI